MTRWATEYEHADHYRDSHKHDRPGYLERTTPLDAQAVARMIKDPDVKIDQAADLIEAYYGARRSAERLECVAAGANS